MHSKTLITPKDEVRGARLAQWWERSPPTNVAKPQDKILASTPSVVWVCCWLACENIRFSSLFAAGYVSRGGTSATQRRKFHTDDANQFLQNNSGSHGFPNINLSNFTCLLIDFGKVLCPSANKLQQNSNAPSREDYIPQILTVLLQILRVYIWPLLPFAFCLSFVNNS